MKRTRIENIHHLNKKVKHQSKLFCHDVAVYILSYLGSDYDEISRYMLIDQTFFEATKCSITSFKDNEKFSSSNIIGLLNSFRSLKSLDISVQYSGFHNFDCSSIESVNLLRLEGLKDMSVVVNEIIGDVNRWKKLKILKTPVLIKKMTNINIEELYLGHHRPIYAPIVFNFANPPKFGYALEIGTRHVPSHENIIRDMKTLKRLSIGHGDLSHDAMTKIFKSISEKELDFLEIDHIISFDPFIHLENTHIDTIKVNSGSLSGFRGVNLKNVKTLVLHDLPQEFCSGPTTLKITGGPLVYYGELLNYHLDKLTFTSRINEFCLNSIVTQLKNNGNHVKVVEA